jgi:hypothetical protein
LWQDLKLYAWKCGQEEESTYMKIFSFTWVELIEVSRASDRF